MIKYCINQPGYTIILNQNGFNRFGLSIYNNDQHCITSTDNNDLSIQDVIKIILDYLGKDQ